MQNQEDDESWVLIKIIQQQDMGLTEGRREYGWEPDIQVAIGHAVWAWYEGEKKEIEAKDKI